MLDNKKVLVVGGGSGIGLGIAHTCHQAGAQVIISSRNEEKSIEAKNEIGPRCSYIQSDVSSNKKTQELFEKAGIVDHVVVTVGKPLAKNIFDLEEDEAQENMNINFWSKFNVAKASLDKLSPNGSILFISGAFGEKPNPNLFMTSVAVSAIEAMTKTLALSTGPKRVNAIAPYVIDTSDLQSGLISEKRKIFLQSCKDSLPAKHVGNSRDIGQAALFLLSSSYSTGVILRLDGGYTIA